MKRVFVSDDEGPAHDETLCGLIDDAEPSRERTVRAAELLRAVRTATHVKWADAADAPAEAPPAKRRRRESSPSRERTTDDGRAARRSARVARSSGIAPIKRELFSDA